MSIKNRFSISLFTLLCLCSSVVSAQRLPGLQVQKLYRQFFKEAEQLGFPVALGNLYATDIYLSPEGARAQAEEQQSLLTLLGSLGNYHGHENMGMSWKGRSVVTAAFMLKFDRAPLRFMITLYKPDSDWVFHRLSYDQLLVDELEASLYGIEVEFLEEAID